MSSTVENNQVEGNFSENDECLKNLKPMEKVLDEYAQPLQGWFRFCDVFSVMPLMVICKTVDITDEVGVGNLVINIHLLPKDLRFWAQYLGSLQ